MNNMPVDWINQIKAEYPARSGGLGWLDMRLMLAVRRALLTHTWEQITDAIKAYKAYCQQSGKEGSELVLKPKSWFEQGGYAEEWRYQVKQDPVAIEKARQSDALDRRADEAGARVGLTRHALESRAAFETRVRMAEMHNASQPASTPVRQLNVQSLVARLVR